MSTPDNPQAPYTPPSYSTGYGQPGYTQVGYAQPGYAQPGYAQPGYPQAAYPYAQPVYYAPPPTNGFAVASFVLALLCFAIFPVILGHMALNQIKNSGERGSAFAIIGLILGYIQITAWTLLILFFIGLIGFGITGATIR